jgi:lysine-specific demethylase/histidyl-hydroxylase NO66
MLLMAASFPHGARGHQNQAMTGEQRALERCVGDVEAFERDFEARRPRAWRRRGTFDDLIDVAAVEALLVRLGRRPTFRVVQAGKTIAPADYTRRSRVGGVEIDDVADVDRVLGLVAGGATLVLQGLQRTWPPLTSFCRDLEDTLSHRVQANAYLSPPDAAGLNRHADLHDVFVLQVAGSKQWAVDGLDPLTLGPHDVLYLPARTAHSARTTGQFSLHITIGLLLTTRRHALRQMIDALDADLDRPLPLGFARTAKECSVAEALTDAVRATVAGLAAVSPHEEARRVVQRARARSGSGGAGRLAVTVDPGAVHDDVELRRRDDLSVSTADDGAVIAACADRRLRLPAVARQAMEVLASGHRVRVGDLPGLDEASRAVLARRLVREGMLELVLDEPAGGGRR